jgi:hypothetical protein
MKMLEKEKSMRGKFMESMLILIAVIFLVMSIVIYVKKDESQGAKALNLTEDNRDVLTGVEEQINKLKEEQKNFVGNITTATGDLVGRVRSLEEANKNINVNLKEPVTFNVVYKEKVIHPGVAGALPEIPPQISGKKTPMLRRAKDNN